MKRFKVVQGTTSGNKTWSNYWRNSFERATSKGISHRVPEECVKFAFIKFSDVISEDLGELVSDNLAVAWHEPIEFENRLFVDYFKNILRTVYKAFEWFLVKFLSVN